MSDMNGDGRLPSGAESPPQHFLNFLPLPQGQGWFRPIFIVFNIRLNTKPLFRQVLRSYDQWHLHHAGNLVRRSPKSTTSRQFSSESTATVPAASVSSTHSTEGEVKEPSPGRKLRGLARISQQRASRESSSAASAQRGGVARRRFGRTTPFGSADGTKEMGKSTSSASPNGDGQRSAARQGFLRRNCDRWLPD